MDVDGYMVINPSLYNQKVIYNGLCFVCLDEIKERDEEKKSD